MDIAKGIDFSINLIVGLIVLLVAGVYVVIRVQTPELEKYAIYFYAFYALLVLAFFWIMKGHIMPKPAAKENKPAKKKAVPAEKKPAAKPAAVTAAPAKKAAAK